MRPSGSGQGYDPPIPTYEEATGLNYETEELLGDSSPTGVGGLHGHYAFPTVESTRSSEDSQKPAHRGSAGGRRRRGDDDGSDEDSEGVEHRDLEQMEVLEVDYMENDSGIRIYPGWKGRFRFLTRRLDRWRGSLSWQSPGWLQDFASHLPRVQAPGMPDNFRQYSPSLPIVARLVGLFIILMSGYFLFVLEIMPSSALTGSGQMFDPESVRIFAQSAVNSDNIREHLRKITQFPHMAGTKGNEIIAEELRDYMRISKMDEVKIDEYWIYMNWPKTQGRRVQITKPQNLAYEVNLEERTPDTDQGSERSPPGSFHAYSHSGNVTGQLIYCNYGRQSDFQVMHDSGIGLKDSIALIRLPKHRDAGIQVDTAQSWGVKGVLIYADPAEDGPGKGSTWPNGRYRPEDSTARDSVALTSYVLGDPLTPGWASTEKSTSLQVEENRALSKIPSLPISWAQGRELLNRVRGFGKEIDRFQGWSSNMPVVEGQNWWTGGGVNAPMIHLQNDQNEGNKERIFNVLGTIKGEVDASSQVVVGSHHDSWCFGAADSASGTAVMLEVINVLGQLRSQGWRPLRTIKFASWDASEYNLAGSTEFVENNLDELRSGGVAYLNVDVGVTGRDFRVSGSPTLRQAIGRILNRVSDPAQGRSLKEMWEERGSPFGGLGAGSDYAAFQDIAGMASLDIGFEGDGYPSRSCYDNFEWMEKYGDPGFEYHKTLAQIWVLLILELAQEPIIPLRYDDYANAIGSWVDELHNTAVKEHGQGNSNDAGLEFASISEAVNLMKAKAHHFHHWEEWWYGQVYGRGGFETASLELQRVGHNSRVIGFDKNLLDLGDQRDSGVVNYPGVPDRTQYKHMLFAPKLTSRYEEEHFPAVMDAIHKGDWPFAQQELDKVARIITNAANKLEP